MALRIAVIPGDGIGSEVVREALRVLEAAAEAEGFSYESETFDLGGARYLAGKPVLADEEVTRLRENHDAILLGAVGHPDVAPGVLEKGLLLRLRFELDQYINLRPVRLFPGVASPLEGRNADDIQFEVVRENTEDLYCGNGGLMRRDTPQEVSTQEMLATRFGVERCLRYAFAHCRRRWENGEGNGRLTLVHKTNVLTYCGDTWFRAFEQIGEEQYPDIERAYEHVDASCMRMVTDPGRYDTLVTPNMFGDILTDLGAAIAGGMGLAASGNLNPDGAAPGMFEPVHGSAPDIAGQDKANPMASALATAMMLRETGRLQGDGAAVAVGDRIERAVQTVCADFAGQSLDRPDEGTQALGDRLLRAVREANAA